MLLIACPFRFSIDQYFDTHGLTRPFCGKSVPGKEIDATVFTWQSSKATMLRFSVRCAAAAGQSAEMGSTEMAQQISFKFYLLFR